MRYTASSVQGLFFPRVPGCSKPTSSDRSFTNGPSITGRLVVTSIVFSVTPAEQAICPCGLFGSTFPKVPGQNSHMNLSFRTSRHRREKPDRVLHRQSFMPWCMCSRAFPLPRAGIRPLRRPHKNSTAKALTLRSTTPTAPTQLLPPKKVSAATHKQETPVRIVGCTTGANSAL